MRAIDADRLLDRCKFYHLPNGDIAVPIIDVQHAPTIEIEPHWIPCGERTPENDNDVLVQMNDGSMMVDFRAASSNGWFWAELDDEPVAWMPLPEPYKGVTE